MNKILLIKKFREAVKVVDSTILADGTINVRAYVGLKDAKDLVEEAMALGVSEHTRDRTCSNCHAVALVTSIYCSKCGIYLN